MQLKPPGYVLEALETLRRAGYAAYLVGGCVRDATLGREPPDYDIASAATPEEVKRVFAGRHVLPTGERHGTVTLMAGKHPLEITTFRADGTYSDGRHPDAVRFSRTIEEDLARRDFTVNAMAWNPWDGLADPYHGRADCENRVLRAVGEPRQRFREDALRILRALRFSAQLGFLIDPETLQAMEGEAEGLSRVSFERVAAELNRTLTAPHAAQALRAYSKVLFQALPELTPMPDTPQRIRFHAYGVWEHTLRVLDGTPPDLALRWAALFHDAGKPAHITFDPDGTTHFRGHMRTSAILAEAALTRLKQPRALTEEVRVLVKHHDDRIGEDNLRRCLSRFGEGTMMRLLMLQKADMAGKAPSVAMGTARLDALIERARRLLEEGTPLKITDLAVDGRDLISLGYAPGPALGETLSRLLRRVLDGRLPNEKTSLLRAAKEYLAETKK